MPRADPGGTSLCGTRWVRVFEEDGPLGAAYRPESVGLPLSRRPRDQFELNEDGSARLFVPGPDDRLIVQDAVWSREGDEIVMHLRGRKPVEIRIVAQSGQRLVVRR